MVNIISFTDSHYFPLAQLRKGLETFVRFQDGEFKRGSIPNSTVWVYNPTGHNYNPEILGGDVGCGIAAFFISKVDPIAAADNIFKELNGKRIIGRGNHFVDICSKYKSAEESEPRPAHNILLIHTHGEDTTIPATIAQAQDRQHYAEEFREQLGYRLARDIGSSLCRMIGNWTHNSIEETEQGIIYRKGAVKVQPNKIHILPESIGATVLFYTVTDERPLQLPPYLSMPHATGRTGPIGQTKVSLEQVREMRRMPGIPYIPPGIPDSALRTEHPSCFNSDDQIFRKLGIKNNFYTSLGECQILSYVGKI